MDKAERYWEIIRDKILPLTAHKYFYTGQQNTAIFFSTHTATQHLFHKSGHRHTLIAVL